MMKYWLMRLPDCDAEIVVGPALLLNYHELGHALDDPVGASLCRVVVPAKRAGKPVFKIVPGLYALRENGGCQIKLTVKDRLLEFDNLDGSHRVIMDISRLQPEYFKRGFCYIGFLDPGKFAVEARDGDGYWLTGVSLPDDYQEDNPVRMAEKIPGAVVCALTSDGDPFSVFARFPDDPIKDMALAEVAKGALGALYKTAHQRDASKKLRYPEKLDRVKELIAEWEAKPSSRNIRGLQSVIQRELSMDARTARRYIEAARK